MWARYARRNLPLGKDHTNNRLENAFGKMKADLRLNNTSDVTIEMAILHLVQWAESKLDYWYVSAQRKRMQIQDISNPEIVKVYLDAAEDLNDTGCIALKKSYDSMKKREDKMTMSEDGVVENMGNDWTSIDDLEDDIDEDQSYE